MTKKAAYTEADVVDVMDNPEWTAEEAKAARPFAEMFPGLAVQMQRNVRGPGRKPKKELVSLRVSPQTLAAFRETGDGWQKLMNEALDRAARRIKKHTSSRNA